MMVLNNLFCRPKNRYAVLCVSDRGSPIKIEKRGGIILKIKLNSFMITIAYFALFFHVEFAYCGMFDFLNRGMDGA